MGMSDVKGWVLDPMGEGFSRSWVKLKSGLNLVGLNLDGISDSIHLAANGRVLII